MNNRKDMVIEMSRFAKVWLFWNLVFGVTFTFGFIYKVPYMYWTSVVLVVGTLLVSYMCTKPKNLAVLTMERRYPCVPLWLDLVTDYGFCFLMAGTGNQPLAVIYALHVYFRCDYHEKIMAMRKKMGGTLQALWAFKDLLARLNELKPTENKDE